MRPKPNIRASNSLNGTLPPPARIRSSCVMSRLNVVLAKLNTAKSKQSARSAARLPSLVPSNATRDVSLVKLKTPRD
jgi:hypothetical protein